MAADESIGGAAGSSVGWLTQVVPKLEPAPVTSFVRPIKPVLSLPSANSSSWQPEADDARKRRLADRRVRTSLDRIVFDAAWWQLLGPGHIERLERHEADSVLEMLEPVATADGQPRWQLTIGEPAEW